MIEELNNADKKNLIWNSEEIVSEYENLYGPISPKEGKKYATLTKNLSKAVKILSKSCKGKDNNEGQDMTKLPEILGGTRGKGYYLVRKYRYDFILKNNRAAEYFMKDRNKRKDCFYKELEELEQTLDFQIFFDYKSELKDICRLFWLCERFTKKPDIFIIYDLVQRLGGVIFSEQLQMDKGLETLMKYRELKEDLYQLAVYYIEDLLWQGKLAPGIQRIYNDINLCVIDKDEIKEAIKPEITKIIFEYQEIVDNMLSMRCADKIMMHCEYKYKRSKPKLPLSCILSDLEEIDDYEDRTCLTPRNLLEDARFCYEIRKTGQRGLSQRRIEKELDNIFKKIRELEVCDRECLLYDFLSELQNWENMTDYLINTVRYLRFCDMVKFQYQVKECDRVEFESIYKIANAELFEEYRQWEKCIPSKALCMQTKAMYYREKESSEKLMVSR